MTGKNKFFILVFVALAIKFLLFAYAEIYAPKAKLQYDTTIYLETGVNLASEGTFGSKDENGTFRYELLRTPGYPLFLGVLYKLMKISLGGIILIQILLTIIVAYITFRTAMLINPRLGYLSALIVLFDPPITIFSLMLLTETVFLLLVSLFMFVFTLYLKEKKVKFIVLSAILVAMATYVRPINYFLGLAMVFFMSYIAISTKTKRYLIQALIFLVICYSLIGIWHLRNYRVSGQNTFTTTTKQASYYRKFVLRNDGPVYRSMGKFPYYLNAVSRCVVSLMTDPGTLKYFGSSALRLAGKILAYPWMIFWLIGFLVGIAKIEKNFYLQFLLFVVVYFIYASIGGVLFGVGSRMRAPMVPFIAILSANGWLWINYLFKKEKAY